MRKPFGADGSPSIVLKLSAPDPAPLLLSFSIFLSTFPIPRKHAEISPISERVIHLLEHEPSNFSDICYF